MLLQNFLQTKPLYYDEIDYSRMPRIYESIKAKLRVPKIIHIIGTNGKGTTGRFLASALHLQNLSVGHYTSPHILEFNERIWLNGENVSYKLLESAHKELLLLLTPEDADALSYFEYTTLLAMVLYKDCDYVVLEAGLGGEYDATAVFENILTLVTPIDRDHEAFLGDTIEKIATTKLNAIRTQAIVAKQINLEIYSVAEELAQQKSLSIDSYEKYLDKEDERRVKEIASRLHLAQYLQENLQLAIAALNFLHVAYDTESFDKARLFGRLSSLGENILLDVGHNVLAAQRIYESLKGQKYTLIYNSYRDKNYREILKIMKPIVSDIEIIQVDEARIESQPLMQSAVEDLGYEYRLFKEIQKDKNYLVFGSFSVAEAFLKIYNG